MKLSRLLLGLPLAVDIAHGAAGRAWEGRKGPRAVVPTLKQAATAVPVIPIIDDPLGPPGQLTARLPRVGAVQLGPGLHTLSIVVTTPAGTFGNTMTYEVIPNME